MLVLRVLALTLCCSVVCACTGQPETESIRDTGAAEAGLQRIFDWYHEFSMREYPEWASYEGDHRFSDRLTDNSDTAIAARYDSLQTMLDALQTIDFSALSAVQQLNYGLFERSLKEQVADRRFNGFAMPLTQQSGIHIEFPQIIDYQPLATVADYDKYFKRLRAFPEQVENAIANMRLGIDMKLMQPDFVIEQVLVQIENIRNKPAGDTPFMLPLQRDTSMSAVKRAAIEKELKQLIGREVQPAYNRLHAFLKEHYLPHCRKEAGTWALPDGEERYRRAIRHHTTTDLSADEIFAIGMGEVERIYTQIQQIKDALGFKGDMLEFYTWLRSNPRFYYTDKEDLMREYRRILDRMDAKLPQLFGRLPKAPYALKEMEAYRAASAPQAYYYPAPEDRSRPGYFYVNTYDLPSRPRYTMTALALHEAVPGHHLQIAIAQELENMPWFRRNLGFTAFVEGWGLYAEFLGYETDMYTDTLQHLGALTFEIWRACRLVVDAGIHAKQWTREQAVEFMAQHTPNSELDIRSEIDRYIVWPGQALAYKIGELKLKELRRKSEERLGAAFDVREFHDTMLGGGAIPLSMLEERIEAWLASKIEG